MSSSLLSKVENLFTKKKHEEHEDDHLKTRESREFPTVLRTYNCPCHTIKEDQAPHILKDEINDTRNKTRAKGEFDLIFSGPNGKEHYEILNKNKDRLNDILSFYGEITWSKITSDKDHFGDEQHTVTGFFIPGPFKLNGITDYGHFIKLALGRIFNSKSTIVNPTWNRFPSTLKINHKALSLTCTGPLQTTINISQSITNPATLVFLMRDQTSTFQVYPTAWRVMNFTSSSATQTITFYHQLAVGITPVSGTAYSVNAWIETDFGIYYETYPAPNNLNFSGECTVAPDVLMLNYDSTDRTFGVGFSQLGNGTSPDSFDVTGVCTTPSGYTAYLNDNYKAVKYKVYCNLPTTYTQGQVITASLPTANLLLNNEYMWSYPASVSFLLSESGGVYTYTQTA